MSHPFLREGDPLWSQGEGAYQSVTSTKKRGGQAEGDRDESPFPRRGWGDRDELSFSGGRGTLCRLMERRYDGGPALTQYWLDNSFPRRGGGTVMSHSKGACPKGKEGGSTNHNEGEGGQIMVHPYIGLNMTNVLPVLAECWPIVYNLGLAVKRHRVKVVFARSHHNTMYWPNVRSMLKHCHRWWHNI